jgi:hypothetical protein
MQVPTNAYTKVLFDPTVRKNLELTKQKDTLLTILTEYIEKTTDKQGTLTKLSGLTKTTVSSTTPCTNC